MKNWLVGICLAAALAAGTAFANPTIFKAHKDLTATDGSKVNCAYCHTKAGVPKAKNPDLAKQKKAPLCAGKGCH